MGHDVTERRRAEDERAQSELRLRTLVEATQPAHLDHGSRAASIDRPMESWSEFTGQTDEEVLGDGWTDAIHPDDRERVLDDLEGGRRRARGVRLRVPPADRRRRVPLDRGARGAAAGRGRRAEYFGVGHDITKRKRAEEAARRRVELESIVAAVSTRLAGATLDTVDLAVDFALGETGRCLGADRVSLYLLAPDGVHARARAGLAPGHGPAGGRGRGHDLERLDWLREHVPSRAARSSCTRSTTCRPRPWREREVFASMGLESVLAVPVLQEPTLVGLLSYEIEAGSRRTGRSGAGPRTTSRWSGSSPTSSPASYVWRADELNLRSIADGFLAFGPDVDKNLTQICRAAGMITGADVVLYTRRRGRELVTEAGWNVPDGLPRVHAGRRAGSTPTSWRRPASRCTSSATSRTSLYAHTSPIIERIGARTYAGFPVIVGGRPVGHAELSVHGDVTLRESQLELLRVLGRAAAVEEERRRALEDRVLGLAQLEQAMERTVGTLSGAVGARDPYTAGHEKRVGELAVAIGKKLGLDADDLRLLRLAAASTTWARSPSRRRSSASRRG